MLINRNSEEGVVMVSALDWTNRAFQVQALAGDTVLYSWARHFKILALPLSTQL